MRAPALALCLFLAACGGGTAEPQTAPSPVGTTAAPTPSPTASPAPPAPVIREVSTEDFEQFTAPSGNIACVLEDTYARCDVQEHTWALPPRPAGCEGDWGPVVSFELGKPAEVGGCVTDSAAGGSELPYDHGIRIGKVQCVVRRTGVTCEQLGSTHGFTVSKGSVRAT